MRRIGEIGQGLPAILDALPRMALNPFLWAALAAYGISVLLWMTVLSRVEVSFAYAFTSLGFVIVTVFGFLLFQEHITIGRILGIALICVGIFLVAKN